MSPDPGEWSESGRGDKRGVRVVTTNQPGQYDFRKTPFSSSTVRAPTKLFLSLLLLLLPASLLYAQAFGRFGYAQLPRVDGLSVEPTFVAVAANSADHLRFEHPASMWGPVATSDFEQTISFGKDQFSPAKIRITLSAPGVSMYCPNGLRFHLSTPSSPYLTWVEGSVSNGVPTPASDWLVLSFATKQPPLIFGFPSAPCSMRIDGRAGDWTLSFSPLKGWVRVGPLLGIRGVSANTAFTLGQLSEQAAKQADLYTMLPPKLLGLSVESDLESVTATWRFDRPGAVLPTAAALADLGGYPIKIQSPFHRVEFDDPDGPLNVLSTRELRVRFPVKRVPTGRGVGIGAHEEEPLGTAAPNDIPSVVELALENLVASRSHLSQVTGQETFDEFFNQAEYATEPWTRQQLPYAATGRGIDLCAAHALLEQALSNASQTKSDQNSLLTSVDWRRDWLTWRLSVDDPLVARRAAALAALAGALCPEPERRLDAAMLEAGLAAERGLLIWRSHRDASLKVPALLEAEYGLRQALFSLTGPKDKDDMFIQQVLSPIRVYGDVALSATQASGKLKLSWPVVESKPSHLSLASGFPVDLLRGGNFSRFKVGQTLGLTELHYIPEFSGDCWAFLTGPPWVKPLPPSLPVPPYSEEYK
jgi:hypothetical protein